MTCLSDFDIRLPDRPLLAQSRLTHRVSEHFSCDGKGCGVEIERSRWHAISRTF